MCLKDQTYLTHAPEVPFLKIDVKGGDKAHQSLSHKRKCTPKASRGEMSYLQEGKDMLVCVMIILL